MTIAITTDTATIAQPSARPQLTRIEQTPPRPEARGFVLYVGFGEDASTADGVPLAKLVHELRELTAQLAPSAATHATVALAPEGAGGADLEVVRRALGPALRQAAPEERVVIDLANARVELDGTAAPLTFTEFELLRTIVTRRGETISRTELLDTVWGPSNPERPNARTIDVHVRRLRAKLGDYADLIRTVRGAGYRYDGHPKVTIR